MVGQGGKRGRWMACCWILATGLAFWLTSAMALPAVTQAEDASPLQWAYVDVPAGTTLDDILANRTHSGFTPVLDDGVHVLARNGHRIWIRLRVRPSTNEPQSWVWIDRQAIDFLRLYDSSTPANLMSEAGLAAVRYPDQASWPDAFEIQLPATNGPATWYLEVQGEGHLNLAPRLLTEQQRNRRNQLNSVLYNLLYGGFFLIAVLSIYRDRGFDGRSRWIAYAALASLLATLVSNYHLQLTLGGLALTSSAALPVTLWILACTPLLWATEHFAGIDHNIPILATGFKRLGLVLLAVGLGVLYLSASYLGQLQWAGLLVLAGVALISVFSLLFDPRQWRWVTILLWLALLPALGTLVLWMVQLPPGGRLARRGFEFILLLQLALYLFLPWIRQALQHRARQRRAVVPEESAEQLVAQAREVMLSSLQVGLENATGGDLEWIAYRRLLGGLKPVLAQRAAAVAAMNYHSEDLLLVEPAPAESRFQTLLNQRGALLKSLSRSKSPQQITIDFDGPEGPLDTVRLAVIPLPIEKPGWGVLLIEREEGAVYSDEELALATEFAALATTAGIEADRLIKTRISSEIDVESGVYRRDMIDQTLTKLQEAAFRQGKLLSVLHIGIDKIEEIVPEQLPTIAHALADLIREEVDYGETIGRLAPDQFMVLAPGRAIGVARDLAERICMEVRAQHLSGGITVSIGVSQMMPGERNAQFMRVRAANALAKARLYGGNQVQAVASSTQA